jgi:hypothetical protein
LTSADPRLVIGADLLQARHAVHRFFDRPRDRHLHLIDRRDAVIDTHHDARKIGRWEIRPPES